MTETLVEIPSIKWEKQRKLGLDKGFSDALRDYARARWPHHTAKYAAREWDLSVDEGRGIVAGTASKTTVEKVFKRGGPGVAVPVLEEVIGVQFAGLFRQHLINAAKGAADAMEHEDAARSAYGLLSGRTDPPGHDGDRAPTARQARSFTGAVGASQAGGVER